MKLLEKRVREPSAKDMVSERHTFILVEEKFRQEVGGATGSPVRHLHLMTRRVFINRDIHTTHSSAQPLSLVQWEWLAGMVRR